MEKELKTDLFIRVHQSYLVNYLYIKTVSQKEIVTMDDQVIQISEERSDKVQEKYIQLVKRELLV